MLFAQFENPVLTATLGADKTSAPVAPIRLLVEEDTHNDDIIAAWSSDKCDMMASRDE